VRLLLDIHKTVFRLHVDLVQGIFRLLVTLDCLFIIINWNRRLSKNATSRRLLWECLQCSIGLSLCVKSVFCEWPSILVAILVLWTAGRPAVFSNDRHWRLFPVCTALTKWIFDGYDWQGHGVDGLIADVLNSWTAVCRKLLSIGWGKFMRSGFSLVRITYATRVLQLRLYCYMMRDGV